MSISIGKDLICIYQFVLVSLICQRGNEAIKKSVSNKINDLN